MSLHEIILIVTVLIFILVIVILVFILAFVRIYSKPDTFMDKFHLKWKDLEIDISNKQKNGSPTKNRSNKSKKKD